MGSNLRREERRGASSHRSPRSSVAAGGPRECVPSGCCQAPAPGGSGRELRAELQNPTPPPPPCPIPSPARPPSPRRDPASHHPPGLAAGTCELRPRGPKLDARGAEEGPRQVGWAGRGQMDSRAWGPRCTHSPPGTARGSAPPCGAVGQAPHPGAGRAPTPAPPPSGTFCQLPVNCAARSVAFLKPGALGGLRAAAGKPEAGSCF